MPRGGLAFSDIVFIIGIGIMSLKVTDIIGLSWIYIAGLFAASLAIAIMEIQIGE